MSHLVAEYVAFTFLVYRYQPLYLNGSVFLGDIYLTAFRTYMVIYFEGQGDLVNRLITPISPYNNPKYPSY